MLDGKRQEDWDQVSVLCCLVANMVCKKSDRLKMKDFHPYISDEKPQKKATVDVARLSKIMNADPVIAHQMLEGLVGGQN